jgi:ATP synthase protein I
MKMSGKVRTTERTTQRITDRTIQRTTERTQDGQMRALGLNTGWTVFGYLIAGMLAYGAIGWGIGRAVHLAILFPVGMLAGLGISLGYVIHRFGRQGQGQRLDNPNDTPERHTEGN